MKYEVKGANRQTGNDIEIVVEASSFRDAERKANELGVVVADVRECHERSSENEKSGSVRTESSRKHPYQCKVCEKGTLRLVKVFSLSPVVVVIGFILLIPSLLSMIGFGVMILLAVLGFGAVATVDPLSGAAVGAVSFLMLVPMIAGLIASFVGGLLGWILVMRKKILQCNVCHAATPAS